MKNFRFWKKFRKFLEEEAAEEYNGDTLGMYIGGTIGTLMMVALILMGEWSDKRNSVWECHAMEALRISGG